MIVSVSRRTDIPAYYSEWFFRRLEDGYAYVRNPFNQKQVSKVWLSPKYVDCFVFWTKDQRPLVKNLELLDGYNYYFQITVTPYDNTIEPNVVEKEKIIDSVIDLSQKIGNGKIVWRYDPILINQKYGKAYHYEAFEKTASLLSRFVNKCVISFIDNYREVKRNINTLKLQEITDYDMREIASKIALCAGKYNLKVESCSEKIDLSEFGIEHGSCIDSKIVSAITGLPEHKFKPDKIRTGCGCVKSVDIGDYNCCPHGCAYCYANYNFSLIEQNNRKSDIDSPLIVGKLRGDEKITVHNLCNNLRRE